MPTTRERQLWLTLYSALVFGHNPQRLVNQSLPHRTH